MLYLFLEDTEWPWVVLVCMQTVVLMPRGKKFMSKIAPPYLTNYFGEILPDQVLIIFAGLILWLNYGLCWLDSLII